MSLLFLVRHGQAMFSGGNYDRLSDLGKVQAEHLGRYWGRRGFRVDRVLCGTLKRHLQTAGIAGRAYEDEGGVFPEIQTNAGLNEIDSFELVPKMAEHISQGDPAFGILAQKTKDAWENGSPDLDALFHQTYHRVMDAWLNNRYPDFPERTWDDFRAQVLASLEPLADCGPDERAAVFTSGNPMAVFVQKALALSDPKTMEVADVLVNCNVTSFEFNGSDLTLTGLNHTAHLNEDQITIK